jgi:predicted dehydrogenase
LLALLNPIGDNHHVEKILFCGLGLIGRQRLNSTLALGFKPQDLYFLDPGLQSPAQFTDQGLKRVNSIQEALGEGVSKAIVAMPHHLAFSTIQKLLECQVKVLAEKPPGRNLSETALLCGMQNSNLLSIGFNYRHMPGIIKLKELLASNYFGEVHTIKMQLGHGGSPDDAKSWKLDPNSAGGGALLDPGIHLLDLLIFLTDLSSDDFTVVGSRFWSGFWNTGIEEQFFGLLESKNCLVSIDSSIVRWKTSFTIEIVGRDGYAIVTGRGRSDGPQIMRVGKRWAWLSGKSQVEEEEVFSFGYGDNSIAFETKLWFENESSIPSIFDAYHSMQLEEAFRNHANAFKI